jgi:hypothetical protein
MSGSGTISGKKKDEPLYDEPTAIGLPTVKTAQSGSKQTTESNRLRTEKTQKEGHELIGELDNCSFMESVRRSFYQIFV